MNNELIIGFAFGVSFIPFTKQIWSIYLWSIPEWGVIEEPWKTEFEESINNSVIAIDNKLERMLYHDKK